MKRIGVALGAGGARGLAHIVILEAFEELGLKPSVISGTSMGAVVGAGYAAGLSSSDMKTAVEQIRTSRTGRFWKVYNNSDFKLVLAFVDPTTKTGGLIKGQKFIQFLDEQIGVSRFEDLSIPLRIVATNYWNKEEVVLSKGNLLKAVQASYSMPGLFVPVKIGKVVLVDGGLTNPLPYDIIKNDCDITVGIDVSAKGTHGSAEFPPAYDILFAAFQIMQRAIVSEKLKYVQPDILIQTDIKSVRSLEFNKASSIYRQALPYKDELKRKLEEQLR